MSEYDYSGLYNNNSENNSAPGNAPQAQQPAASPPEGGYPNVGSSGMNTANTAPTDYAGQNAAQNGGNAPQAQHPWPNQQAAQDGGYTSSFGGGNGGNGGYNGYSYTSAPQQPPHKAKNGSAKKIWMRVAAGVGVVVLGFGGGLAGTIVASRTGLIGGQVVVQTVERNNDTSAISQGSATGTSLSLQDVSAIVSPSVVAITTEQMTSSNTWFGGSYVQSGAGSGVIISQDGYILTCAHVVSGATSISVQLSDDSTYTATIVGADSSSDIAVLKIEAAGLTPAVLGDSDTLAVGEDAVAVGNPLGTLGGTVTNGIISALNRSVTVDNNQMTLIQTSASISPGNSCGGLFNGNGELIGIVNAKSGYSEAEGLGFAIPINTAMEISQSLIDDGYVKRPALGITVVTIADANTAMQYGVTSFGVYIAQVNTGSGAESAGLQAGDRLVSVGDTVISQSSDLTSYLRNLNIGDTVTVQIERDGKLSSVDVVLGESSQS